MIKYIVVIGIQVSYSDTADGSHKYKSREQLLET